MFTLSHAENSSSVPSDAKELHIISSKKQETGIRSEVVIKDAEWNKAIEMISKQIKKKAPTTHTDDNIITVDANRKKIQDHIHQVDIERKPNNFEVSSRKEEPDIEVMVTHFKIIAAETGVDSCLIDSSPSPEITARLIISLMSKDPKPSIIPIIEDVKILTSLREKRSAICRQALEQLKKLPQEDDRTAPHFERHK